MRWPWSRTAPPTEHRSQSFADAVVSALVTAAGGSATSTAAATAALEACAALYAAAFAVARVQGAPPMVERALTPATLALIARNAIRRGEDIHVIDVDGGGLRLTPAGSWDLRGGHDPRGWWVRADLFGPSGNATRLLPHAAVVHVRYSTDPSRPWLGLGPLQWATSTGQLAGRLEAGLANEAGAAAAQLVPVPADGGDGDEDEDPLASLKTDLANAKGAAMLVESTAEGWDGSGPAPRRDWQQSRIGPDWPDVLRDTRVDVGADVAACCNVPAALLDRRAEGTSQREALRRFLHLGIEPLGVIVAAELAAKLEAPDLSLDFSPLMASDLAGKARAIKGLVDAGVNLPEAVMVAGLE